MGTGTLGETLRARAQDAPSTVAFRAIADDVIADGPCLSYAQLLARAEALGARLSEAARPGDRAALLLPAGLDFAVAVLACLLAGVVAVPAFPPPRGRDARRHPRLRALWSDAAPTAVLASGPAPGSEPGAPRDDEPWARAPWIRADEAPSGEGGWTPPAVGPDALALLQYTSGSTARPRGVMLSNANLVANCEAIRRRAGLGPDDCTVMWVPPHHDMGLVGGILAPLHAGYPSALMSPTAFLRRPGRWLAAVSDLRGTIAGVPNFALDLCADALEADPPGGLDLACLRKLFVSAEPVRAQSLRRFAAAAAPHGFAPEGLRPSYGLAEATLLVASGEMGAPTVVREPAAAADRPRGAPLVGCGHAVAGHEVAVVDPATGGALPDGETGEIRVRGPSVALGYWQDPEGTARTFPEGGDGATRWLRTGDEGFLADGELFVSGRTKDVVILRGRKVHPEDVETSVAAVTHRHGRVAAFGVDDGDREHLIVVQVVGREFDGPGVVGDVLEAVVTDHGVQPSAVLCVRSRHLPLTTSGKVRRAACREAFTAGALPTRHEWRHPSLGDLGRPIPQEAR